MERGVCAAQTGAAEGRQIERGWGTVSWMTFWHSSWSLSRYPLVLEHRIQYRSVLTDWRSALKGFFEQMGFMRKRKRKYHTLVRGASMFHSPSLFLCPRLPAIPLRLLQHSPTQQTRFLPLDSTILSGGTPSQLLCFSQSSLLHLLTCALISHRWNNTVVLFKLCCTQLSHLQNLWNLYCMSYTSHHKAYVVDKSKARRTECVFSNVLTRKKDTFIKGAEQWQHLSAAVRMLITWARIAVKRPC